MGGEGGSQEGLGRSSFEFFCCEKVTYEGEESACSCKGVRGGQT